MHRNQGNNPSGQPPYQGYTVGAGHHDTGYQAEQQMGSPMGGQLASQMGGQMGSHMGGQMGSQMGGQMGSQMGTQMGTQLGGQMGSQMGGQMGAQMGGQQQTQKFGAMELLQVHEVLTHHIDGINQFQLYRPHVKDQKLMQILDNQLNHMYNGYQSLVSFMQNQGMIAAVPYRAPKVSDVRYGLRQPQPVEPNANETQMDDRDVASAMMGCAKASAMICTTAALECADPNLRMMMTDCVVSSINQAYEIFHYMNSKGMYQVPTLAGQTTQTMMNLYQSGSQPQFQQQ